MHRGGRYLPYTSAQSEIHIQNWSEQAFMQILVAEASRKYTVFGVQGKGLYQFKSMPLGLVNRLKTFFLLPNLCSVWARIWPKRLRLSRWFDHNKRGFRDWENTDKCEFECTSITYLGHLLDKDGLRPDPEIVKPVLDMPRPTNVKELRRGNVWLECQIHCKRSRKENSSSKTSQERY